MYLGEPGDAQAASARPRAGPNEAHALASAHRVLAGRRRSKLAAAGRRPSRCRLLARSKLAAAQARVDTARQALDYSPSDRRTRRCRPTYPQTSTGRRTALAKWITSPDNPLTARVAVNHIWAGHFGRPLVETTSNFGRSGKPPTHPELLDWLAAELMDEGLAARSRCTG